MINHSMPTSAGTELTAITGKRPTGRTGRLVAVIAGRVQIAVTKVYLATGLITLMIAWMRTVITA